MTKKIAFVSIALGLGTVLGVGFCEIALRVLRVEHLGFYQVDPVLGVALRPDVSGWYRSEGEAFVRISSAGLRDREHPLAKPAGTVRIAVLGDSYAEARQVELESTFWWLLAQSLESCPRFAGRKVEPLNFGVSGYGTAQELLMLRDRAWAYSPDVVLLVFVPNNDLRNNVRELERAEIRPYFVLEGDRLVLDDRYLESTEYRKRETWLWRVGDRLMAVSRLVQLANHVRNLQLGRQKAKILEHGVPEGLDAGLSHVPFLQPPDATWRRAWAVTEAMIAQMAREVRSRGAEFWLAIATSGIQVHPDPEVRREFQERIGAADLFEVERRLGALGRSEGFGVVPLGPGFQARAEREGVFAHGFENAKLGGGHWNQVGHRWASEAISAAICPGPTDVAIRSSGSPG